jgi:hypothetical protein
MIFKSIIPELKKNKRRMISEVKNEIRMISEVTNQKSERQEKRYLYCRGFAKGLSSHFQLGGEFRQSNSVMQERDWAQ